MIRRWIISMEAATREVADLLLQVGLLSDSAGDRSGLPAGIEAHTGAWPEENHAARLQLDFLSTRPVRSSLIPHLGRWIEFCARMKAENVAPPGLEVTP
jgi:hypothetical protein